MSLIRFLIYYLLSMIITYVVTYCYAKITLQPIRYTKKKVLLILCILIVSVLNNLYNIISARYLCSIFIYILINLILFKNNLKYTVFNTVICSIITIIVELILSGIMLYKIKNINELNNNILLKVTFTLIDCVCLIMIFRNIKIIDILHKIKQNFNFYTISFLIILFINIILAFKGISLDNYILIIISIMCSIFIVIIFKTIINDKYNIRILEDKNKHLKETYDAYSNTIDEYKEFKHNLKNELYSLKVALPEEYQPIVNKIILKYNKETDWINRIDKMPQGIQGILYLKIQEASYKKVKIIVNTKIFTKFENNNFLDLSNVIGILIDNAIDASSLTKNKIIVVNIEETKSFINIKMINKFINSVDLNQIGKKNYSTKVYKSGLGLNSLKKLKSNNLKIKFNIVNDLFITNILCKK